MIDLNTRTIGNMKPVPFPILAQHLGKKANRQTIGRAMKTQNLDKPEEAELFLFLELLCDQILEYGIDCIPEVSKAGPAIHIEVDKQWFSFTSPKELLQALDQIKN